jgi:hypothetical protein
MAVPTYTTNLATGSLCDAVGTWIEMTTRKSGSSPVLEDRAYIQGGGAISQATGGATGRTTGLQFDYGSNIAWTSEWVFLIWQFFQAPKVIGSWVNGGMRLGVGSTAGNTNLWNTQGNDYGRNPYGGWDNVAVDPEYSPDETEGAAVAGVYRYFYSAPYMLSAVSKGNPHCVDAIRYGRGDIVVQYGSSGDGYATFTGMAAANDADAARWGLFQEQFGSYLWKGLMSIGTAANAVEFVDSNKVINVDVTPRTYQDFNKIEINNAGSVVSWTGISISSLDSSSLSPGKFEVTDSTAQVNFTTCSFTDMNTFIFELTCTILSTTFRRCGQVTQGGGVFDGCIFDESDAAVSLLVDDLDNIDNCDFTSDGSNHAIELTEEHAGGSYTLTGCTYNGYAGIDGSTGNEVIFNDSSGSVIINVVGGDAPTIRNGLGASTSLPTSVALTMTVKDEDGAVIVGAYAYIDDDNITPFIMNTTTNASGVATVQHTGGAAPGSTWRCRKYGFKSYKQAVDIAGDDISLPITLIADPQQT